MCDTNAVDRPQIDCDVRSTCGSVDPRENYMSYSYDRCLTMFSDSQIRRMRCELSYQSEYMCI